MGCARGRRRVVLALALARARQPCERRSVFFSSFSNQIVMFPAHCALLLWLLWSMS